MAPKPKPSLLELLLVHLTRQEFKICFAVDFLADGAEEFEGHFPDMKSFSSPGWENSEAWVEHLRRVIRYLALDLHYEFEYLEVFQNGSIRRRGDVIEPKNVLYAVALLTNDVNFLAALRTAARHATSIGLPREPFLEAVDMIEGAVNARVATIDPERHKQWEAEMDVVLASIGVARMGESHESRRSN